MTEKEIVKSLKQLGKAHRSVKLDSSQERDSYDMLLSSFKEMFPGRPKVRLSFYLALRPVAISLMVLFVVFLSGFGLVKASENAVPGQFLYTVKRVTEKTQLILAFNQSKKTALRADILTTRLKEAKVLTQKIEEGSFNQEEEELNTLAQEVSTEIKNLKKELVARVDHSPENDPLYIEGENEPEDDLPVQDGRQIFDSSQGDALARILKEASDYLSAGNYSAALNNIEEAMQYFEKSPEPILEEEANELLDEIEENLPAPESEEESDLDSQKSSDLLKPQELIREEDISDETLSPLPLEPVESPESEISLPPASTGEVFQGINIKRTENPEQELQTGLIREEE